MKPFLILQLRPEDAASDDEYAAFLRAGGLNTDQTERIRMERQGIPQLRLEDYSAVIVGGGPYCVSDQVKPPEQQLFEGQLATLLDEIIQKDFPYLGACYGLGALSRHLGGNVSREKYGESVGAVTIEVNEAGRQDPVLQGVTPEFRAFGGHKEACQDVPDGATLLAGSATCPVQMICVKRNIYATQFHPELDSAGLAVRIRTYRNAGYFPPQEADQLIALTADENVTEPEKIFRNFVARYSSAN